jgi:hypothetical protein
MNSIEARKIGATHAKLSPNGAKVEQYYKQEQMGEQMFWKYYSCFKQWSYSEEMNEKGNFERLVSLDYLDSVTTFQDEKEKGNLSSLIPVHINKMCCDNYFWSWDEVLKDWVRGEETPENLKRGYVNPLVKSNNS